MGFGGHKCGVLGLKCGILGAGEENCGLEAQIKGAVGHKWGLEGINVGFKG